MKAGVVLSPATRLASWAIVLCGGILYLSPPLLPELPNAGRSAALLVFTLELFALGSLPEALVGLLFFVVGMLDQVAPPEIIFLGFTTGAFWLVFRGMVLKCVQI